MTPLEAPMELFVTVDRMEGDVAVLEVMGRFVDWPMGALPPGCHEGDRLRVTMTAEDPELDEASARLARLRAASSDEDDEIDL